MNQTKYNPNIHHRRSIRLKGYDYSLAGLYFITICVKDRQCLLGKIAAINSDVGANPFVGANSCVRPTMILNDAGIMMEKWWHKIPEKFPDIVLGVYQIMPNHFHAIVINTGMGVVANPRVRPLSGVFPLPMVYPLFGDDTLSDDPNHKKGQTHGSAPTGYDPLSDVRPLSDVFPVPMAHTLSDDDPNHKKGQTHGSAPTDYDHNNPESILGEHMGSPLHHIVQWFKTMSTNEYIRGVKTLGWTPFNGKLLQRNYYEHIIRNERSYQNISEYIVNNPALWKEDKFYEK